MFSSFFFLALPCPPIPHFCPSCASQGIRYLFNVIVRANPYVTCIMVRYLYNGINKEIPSSSALFLFPTVPSITNVSDAEFVLYTHRSFVSPVLSTFLPAIRAGWLKSIPRLTPQLVLNNLPSRSLRP